MAAGLRDGQVKMKYPQQIEMSALISQLDHYDTIIDVRSPSEYAEDHIPGAVNYPVLDDEQRILVGTLYKQVGAFEAKRLGAALVSQNIAHHLQHAWQAHPREWRPLLYCWRGGNRSSATAYILAKIGWQVALLEGGYKEYRRYLISNLPLLTSQLNLIVLCGTTGSGKSRVLQALDSQGAQVLDLEALAQHRGSVLGSYPNLPQPAQKAFESAIWGKLRQFDANQPVYVEAESKKVGNLRVPESLMNSIRNARCIVLHADYALRVQLLMQDYAHFIQQPELLMQQLQFLRQQHGQAKINQWQNMCQHVEQLPALVEQLLLDHYDPSYLRSMIRNFARYPEAEHVQLEEIGPAAMQKLASKILLLKTV